MRGALSCVIPFIVAVNNSRGPGCVASSCTLGSACRGAPRLSTGSMRLEGFCRAELGPYRVCRMPTKRPPQDFIMGEAAGGRWRASSRCAEGRVGRTSCRSKRRCARSSALC